MIPTYLYHYTTVESLEKILANRTIRLMPLLGMDDQEEKIASGGTQLGKLMFISSWTESVEENPRMWREYCRPSAEEGVRIRMRSLPFSKEENHLSSEKDVGEDLKNRLSPFFASKGFDSPLLGLLNCYDDNELAKECVEYGKPFYRKHIIHYPDKIDDRLLKKVKYTNEARLLFPMTHYWLEGRVANNFSDYGLYKNKSWEWQEEWRYRIMSYRAVPGVVHRDRTIDMYDTEKNIDLIIDKVAFSSMQITMSPVITGDAKEALYSIVRKYNPFASIVKSSLNPTCLD